MKSFLLQILYLLPAVCFAGDSLIIETIREHTYKVSFSEGRLTGDGAELLEGALQNHQFVLVGEMHGIREVGEFSEGLFKMGKKHGFKYFALETDPWIAKKLEQLANQPMDSLAAFERKFPLSIPFYGNQSDFSFLESIVHENKGPGRKIWGLDQTFIAATRFHLHEILGKAKSDQARQLVKRHYDKAVVTFQEAMQSRDPGGVYLSKIDESAFRDLEDTFHSEQNFEALEIISGIKKSARIYRHWFEGEYYQNNRVRSRWMKNSFVRYYHEAMFRDGDLPKVFFKFGSNHATRGLTPVHIYDLGNLVSELAESRGNQSLHILFNALKGTSSNMLTGNRVFDHTDQVDKRILEAVGARTDKEDWILIDLRPLRSLGMKNESESFKSLVFGFDLYVLVPNGQPLVPFQ